MSILFLSRTCRFDITTVPESCGLPVITKLFDNHVAGDSGVLGNFGNSGRLMGLRNYLQLGSKLNL